MVVLFLWIMFIGVFIPIRIRVKLLIEFSEFFIVTNVAIGVFNFPFEIAINKADEWVVRSKKSRRNFTLKKDKNKQVNSMKFSRISDVFYTRKLSIVGAIGVANEPALAKSIKNGFIMIFVLIENTILRSFNEKVCFLHDSIYVSNCEIQVDTELETNFFRIILVLFKKILGGKYGQVRSKKFNQKSA